MSINQKKFRENITIAKLPCNHIFEPSGIIFWLKNNNSSVLYVVYQMDLLKLDNNSNNIDISNSNNIDISNSNNTLNILGNNPIVQIVLNIHLI